MIILLELPMGILLPRAAPSDKTEAGEIVVAKSGSLGTPLSHTIRIGIDKTETVVVTKTNTPVHKFQTKITMDE